MKTSPDDGIRTSRRIGRMLKCLAMMFLNGPRQLLTSRISVKCAALMTAMCAPSLLFCALLTIPALIFNSPQQQAYFYFAKLVNEDPVRWLALALATLCAVFSLAVPAFVKEPDASPAV